MKMYFVKTRDGAIFKIEAPEIIAVIEAMVDLKVKVETIVSIIEEGEM